MCYIIIGKNETGGIQEEMKEREEVRGLWKGFLFLFAIVIIFWIIGLVFNHFNPPA